ANGGVPDAGGGSVDRRAVGDRTVSDSIPLRPDELKPLPRHDRSSPAPTVWCGPRLVPCSNRTGEFPFEASPTVGVNGRQSYPASCTSCVPRVAWRVGGHTPDRDARSAKTGGCAGKVCPPTLADLGRSGGVTSHPARIKRPCALRRAGRDGGLRAVLRRPTP